MYLVKNIHKVLPTKRLAGLLATLARQTFLTYTTRNVSLPPLVKFLDVNGVDTKSILQLTKLETLT